MATNQTPPQPPAPQQPAAPQNPGEMTTQQLREPAPPPPAPAAPQPPAAPPPAAPSDMPLPQLNQAGQYEIALPTGQRYQGATPEQAYQQVIQAQINASELIREQRQELDRIRAGVQQAVGEPPAATAGGAMQFDRNVFVQLMNSDPILALDYADACRWKLNSVDEVEEQRQRVFQNTQSTEIDRVTTGFRAMAPDFPGTPEAVDKLMNTMNQQGIPFNAENLNIVHRHLVGLHAQNPQWGYAPAGQVVQPPQPPQQSLPPQVPPVPYNPAPMGPYAYDPSVGFQPQGYPQQPPPVVVPPAPVPGQYISATQAPPQPVGYPQIPVAAYPPVYPMPQAPAAPGPGQTLPQGFASEDDINRMSTVDLRNAIAQHLQR
jgi:hypothetical protein